MLLGGLRRCEVLGLRLSDVRPGERRLFIAEGKGGRQRIVPVSGRFFATLGAYLDSERPRTSTTGWVLVVLKGPRRGQPLSARGGGPETPAGADPAGGSRVHRHGRAPGQRPGGAAPGPAAPDSRGPPAPVGGRQRRRHHRRRRRALRPQRDGARLLAAGHHEQLRSQPRPAAAPRDAVEVIADGKVADVDLGSSTAISSPTWSASGCSPPWPDAPRTFSSAAWAAPHTRSRGCVRC